ncbi:MAG: hypothetical protein U0354_04665 [Candidatus Sericytochromatia bacterium]
MEEIKEKILNIIFLGSNEQVIEFCLSLNDKQKKEVYKYIKPYLNRVRDICKFNFKLYEMIEENTSYGKMVYISQRLLKTKDVMNIFIKENDIEQLDKVIEEKRINIQQNQDSSSIFIKNQMFNVMLCDKKSVLSNLKVTRNDNIMNYQQIKNNSFIYNLVEAILNRNEDWKFDIICEYFENIEKYNQTFFYLSFYDSVALVCEYYKDKKEYLKKYLVKAIYYDVFRNDYQKISKYEPEIICMSLDFYPSDERQLNTFPHPISLIYILDNIKELINNNYLPREYLIDITIKNLLSQNRSSIVTGWVKLYETLNPSKNEVLERKDSYISLLNSISSQGIQIGLNEIKNLLPKLKTDYDLLIELISFNLNNTVQKISKLSFTVLKSLFKEKDKKELVLNSIIKNIYIPNKNLRIEVLKWVKNQELTQEQKNEIKNLFQDSNDLIELEIIKDFYNTNENIDINIKDNSTTTDKNQVSIEMNFDNCNLDNSKISEYIYQILNNKDFDLDFKRIKGSLNNYKQEKKLDLFNSEIELAQYLSLSASSSKKISNIDLEKIFASILKFKNIIDNVKIEKILDPCLKSIEKINNKQEQNEFSFINIPVNNIIACISAYIWLYKEKPSIKNTNYFLYGNYLSYKKLDALSEYIILNNVSSLLSTPDYLNYFIEPKTFANTIINIPIESVNFYDLMSSFFRLNLIDKENTYKSWQIIDKNLNEDDKFSITNSIKMFLGNESELLKQFKINAIKLAFAPLDIAKKYLLKFINYFKNNSPDNFIFHNEFNGSVEDKEETINNKIFYLLNSSLRARYGYENALNEMPELKDMNLDNLKFDLGTDKEKYNNYFTKLLSEGSSNFNFNINPLDFRKYRTTKKFKELTNYEQEYFRELLFYPYSLEKDTLIIKGIENTNFIYVKNDMLYYPNLEHYYSSFEYTGFNYLEPNLEQKISSFPYIAQRLFDLAISKEDKIIEGSKYYIKFLDLSRLNIVDISKGIDKLFLPLTKKNIKDKDFILDSIYDCLKQGKINFNDVINNISSLLSETKGFKYIIESIAYLNSISNIFEVLTILSIEKYLSTENKNTKNISVLLELLIEKLKKYNIKLRNIDSVSFLRELSKSKKNSVLKDNSLIIINLFT